MPQIKEMRASQTRCLATVTLGVTDIGSNVTVNVTLDRKKPEVQQAFSTLENLALREAQSQVKQAQDNTEIDRRVRERLSRKQASA